MRFHPGMQMSRSSRSPRRTAPVLAGVALLAVLATGCGPTEATSAETTLQDALTKVGTKEDATVVAELDASATQLRRFLTERDISLPGRSGAPTRKDAELLARAQLTLSLAGDRPLNESADVSGTRLAGALNFGDRDVFAYKSIGDKLYIRLGLKELSNETLLTKRDRRLIDDLRGIARDLPSSLGAVKAALKGKWVRIDPDAYEDFTWALRKLTGRSGSGERAREASSALEGDAQRKLLNRLSEMLLEDAALTTPGGDGKRGGKRAGADGVERVTATVTARKAAKRLAPALRPLGVDLRPSRVADRDITAEVTIRRGELTELTVDLRELAGAEGPGELPLRLSFHSGDALWTEIPEGPKPKKLEPQDVLAMMLYRSSGAADSKDSKGNKGNKGNKDGKSGKSGKNSSDD